MFAILFDKSVVRTSVSQLLQLLWSVRDYCV